MDEIDSKDRLRCRMSTALHVLHVLRFAAKHTHTKIAIRLLLLLEETQALDGGSRTDCPCCHP